MESKREDCVYGSGCYRRNPVHLKNKRHTHLEDILEKFIADPDVTLDAAQFKPEQEETYRIQLFLLKALREESPGKDASPGRSAQDPAPLKKSEEASAASSADSSLSSRRHVVGRLAEMLTKEGFDPRRAPTSALRQNSTVKTRPNIQVINSSNDTSGGATPKANVKEDWNSDEELTTEIVVHPSSSPLPNAIRSRLMAGVIVSLKDEDKSVLRSCPQNDLVRFSQSDLRNVTSASVAIGLGSRVLFALQNSRPDWAEIVVVVNESNVDASENTFGSLRSASMMSLTSISSQKKRKGMVGTVRRFFKGKGHCDSSDCSGKSCCSLVSVEYPKCGHKGLKLCHQKLCDVLCNERVTVELPECQHQMQMYCHQSLHELRCAMTCESKMACGVHKCASRCGEPHNHDNCRAKVSYTYPECRHKAPVPKECSQPVVGKCRVMLMWRCPRGHETPKRCHEAASGGLSCLFPCPGRRSCGHPCTGKCGQDCDLGECSVCESALEDHVGLFRAQAEREEQDLQRRLKEETPFVILEIAKTGATKAEYQTVEDLVHKNNHPMHCWNPVITKIEKVINLHLEERFAVAKQTSFGQFVDSKFHGSSVEGVHSICREGFRLPPPPTPGKRPGMFGQGVYFATDSSKSAQHIYTKGSNRIILCNVILGRSKELTQPDSSMSKEKLQAEGFDSVYAPRKQSTLNDEYTIFDPSQALPKYVIHYTTEDTDDINSGLDFQRIKLVKRRCFDRQDPLDLIYRVACERYVTMKKDASNACRLKEIDSVELIHNKRLSEAFEAKKREFGQRGLPDEEVLAFHGTAHANIDNILRTNLDPKRAPTHGRMHGQGCYFSEFPDVSLGYGEGLILFRVLPGREYSGTALVVPEGFNSKKVNGDNSGFGEMLVITDTAQFVPYILYHFK